MFSDKSKSEFCLHEVGALRREIEIRWSQNQREVDLARIALDKRLNSMNELRDQITAERGHYVSNERYDTRHSDLQRRLNDLENFRSNVQGRIAAGAIVLSAAVAIVTSIVSHSF